MNLDSYLCLPQTYTSNPHWQNDVRDAFSLREVVNLPYIPYISTLTASALGPFTSALKPVIDLVLAEGALQDPTAGGAHFSGAAYAMVIENGCRETSLLMAQGQVAVKRPMGAADFVASAATAIAQVELALFLGSAAAADRGVALLVESVSLAETEAALLARAEHLRAPRAARFAFATRAFGPYEAHGVSAARTQLAHGMSQRITECIEKWHQLENDRIAREFSITSGDVADTCLIPLPPAASPAEWKYIWASRHNSYGSGVRDICSGYGTDRQLSIHSGGWRQGAFLALRCLAANPQVHVNVGSYAATTELPIPDGYTEAECHFFWMSQGTPCGPHGHTGDRVFTQGISRRAGVGGGCLGGVWLVIGVHANDNVYVSTGTSDVDMFIPFIDGAPEVSYNYNYFWAAGTWPGNTGDCVCTFGTQRRIVVQGHGSKGISWIAIATRKQV